MTRREPEPRDHGGRRAVRLVAAALLLADGLSAALGVAATFPGLVAHQFPALAMITLRAASGALEATGGWFLLGHNPAAVPIARAGVLVAATYATLGIGARLAPTSLDPAFRFPVVVGYWAYALIVLTLLKRT